MIVVLDASAALAVALNTADAVEFSNILGSADAIIAPDIYPSEIVNTFWKYAKFSHLEADKCQAGIAHCIDLIDIYINTKDLAREAFANALAHQHPAYDMFYAIAARRHDASLLSQDKKLIQIAQLMGVKTIGG